MMANINLLKQGMEPRLPFIANATVRKISVATAVHDAGGRRLREAAPLNGNKVISSFHLCDKFVTAIFLQAIDFIEKDSR